MARYIINEKTGKKYRQTIATRKIFISMVKSTKEKMFFADAYGKNKENKAYICYNTEFYLPPGFHYETQPTKPDELGKGVTFKHRGQN